LKIRVCKHCGAEIDRIVFNHLIIEEWQWDGEKWLCECNSSRFYDPKLEALCSECEDVVGTAKDFGFC